MECRGCGFEVLVLHKMGLCLACTEDLDRWVYLREQEENAKIEAEAIQADEMVRKAG